MESRKHNMFTYVLWQVKQLQQQAPQQEQQALQQQPEQPLVFLKLSRKKQLNSTSTTLSTAWLGCLSWTSIRAWFCRAPSAVSATLSPACTSLSPFASESQVDNTPPHGLQRRHHLKQSLPTMGQQPQVATYSRTCSSIEQLCHHCSHQLLTFSCHPVSHQLLP